MSTRQHNRGPHPADKLLFSQDQWPVLQQAVDHLSWLLTRGYAPPSSLKLVGDRFSLVARQRTAIMRSACSDQSLENRTAKGVDVRQLSGRSIEVDALNLLITLESALSGGVVLQARDETYRDMASIHGSYRRVDQTHTGDPVSGRLLPSSSSRIGFMAHRPACVQQRSPASDAVRHGYRVRLELGSAFR